MILDQYKKDYTQEIKDFIKKYKIKGYVEKQNDYVFHILTTWNLTVTETWIRIFPLWVKVISTIDETGKEKKIKYNEFIFVDATKSIDFAEYFTELENEWIIKYEDHIGSVGYSVIDNKPVVNDLLKNLHWLVVWASGSWKGILMRTLLMIMWKFPESEFIILDKDGDFNDVKSWKKVIFQQDFRVILNPVERFINFLTYLNMYQSVRSQKFQAAWCNEWYQYNDKRRKEIEENGSTNMELIPYLTIVMDEFQTFRKNASELLWWDEFDWRIGVLLNVCRANGIRVIIWTQDTQKNIVWGSLTNVQTRAYYKINTSSNSDNLPQKYFDLINSGNFATSYIFYLSGIGLVKPPFSNKKIMDKFLNDSLNTLPEWYRTKRYDTVMEMLIDVANGVESAIMSTYYDMFIEIWFKPNEIEEMKKSDNFLTLVSLVYALFIYFDRNLLSNSQLDITIPASWIFPPIILPDGTASPSVDWNIFSYLWLLKAPVYSQIIKNIKETIIWNTPYDSENPDSEENEEIYNNFKQTLWSILKDFYKKNIQKVDWKSLIKKRKELKVIENESENEDENDKVVEEKEIEGKNEDVFENI